jgi:AbrB family looped-hinge helix DNA binding protein
MAYVTISSKNQIVIPKEARDKLGLKPGDKLVVTALDGKVLVMKRPRSYANALLGFAPGLYGPDYLKKERESWR